MKTETLIDVEPLLGEGSIWDVESERLYFIDSLARPVFRCATAGAKARSRIAPHFIGSMALRRGGGALAALQSGFHALDFETGETNLLVNPEPDHPANRLNDGIVDPPGRFVRGSMDARETEPTGNLWRLDADRSVTGLDAGMICSNQPCWSPDGRTLYFADSFTGEMSACEHDESTGSVENKRRFLVVDGARGGAPGGATVDDEGSLWSAMVFAERIFRDSPDRRADGVIETPVVRITRLAFGGANLDEMFVTSTAEPPLPKHPGDGPMRGSVFRVGGLGVRGRTEPRFAA